MPNFKPKAKSKVVGSLAACLFARRGHLVDLYEFRPDIRQTTASRGRTINLSISTRGRKALARAGLERRVLEFAIPLRGRMVHLPEGRTTAVPYDPLGDQFRSLLPIADETQARSREITVGIDQQKECYHDNARTDNNTRVDVRTELTVGADGAFSAVRRRMLHRQFDYEQRYIAHGYIELSIPPVDGEFAIAPNYLHLWPRGDYTIVAMPNQDKSWSLTLFMPFSTFDSLDCPQKLVDFFTDKFDDAIHLIGREKLIEDFFRNKPSPLISIKCYPYHVDDRAVLIGDAAHAMVPFFGQGMNAGLEDCLLLDELIGTMPMRHALKAYTDLRWRDAHAICDLAIYNFQEISSLVTKRRWRLRRAIDNSLHCVLGARWMPLYQSVCFTTTPYRECWDKQRSQDHVRYIHLLYFSLCIKKT
ncbi:Kynurenine 3-monooxygenase [Eumeta japonica]|uniref:Kynurenine 3-monooxygenase n=1 Tax=Eumeta variegata TaxID=151549 RepID=A0A4C1WC77_EUMVA|nr:Kynurenine 3-monooxygenase [Eumeta japonica]